MPKDLARTNRLLKILYIILGSAAILGAVYVLWILIFTQPPLFSWSQVQAYFVVTLESLALLFLYDFRIRLIQKTRGDLFWPILLAFFTLNCAALVFFGQYYSHPERASYGSVEIILKLFPIAWMAVGVGSIFALVKVLQNQFSRAWGSTPFEDEGLTDKKSRLTTLAVISGCFVLGLVIRLINLDGFPPYVDEYITTHNIYRLLNGFPFEWKRAFPTVGIPVLLSYKLFGINLWAGRFPMVVINMIAIIPLFFLGKKIHRDIGFISVALYTINPWIIAVSRTVREYAVLPLFYFVSAVFLLDLLEWENTTFRSYLKKNGWKVLILLLILVNTLYDRQSIIKIVIINFGVFGALLLFKLLKNKTHVLIKVTGIGMSLVFFIILVIVSNLSKRLFENGTIILEAEVKYWQLLISNTNEHWFSQIPQIAWLVMAVTTFFVLRAVFKKYNEKDAVILYCYLVFLSILGFLTYFLVNPHVPPRTRYGILLEYWYVIPVAISVFLVYRLIQKVFGIKPVIRILAYLLLGFSLINFSSIVNVLAYSGGGSLNVTGEKHYNMEPAYRFMLTQLHAGDVLLTDSLVVYDELHEKEFGEVIVYSFIRTILREAVTIDELITRHPEGWIVLTQNSRPENRGLVYESTTKGGISLEYIGRWGECDIWRWKEIGY